MREVQKLGTYKLAYVVRDATGAMSTDTFDLEVAHISGLYSVLPNNFTVYGGELWKYDPTNPSSTEHGFGKVGDFLYNEPYQKGIMSSTVQTDDTSVYSLGHSRTTPEFIMKVDIIRPEKSTYTGAIYPDAVPRGIIYMGTDGTDLYTAKDNFLFRIDPSNPANTNSPYGKVSETKLVTTKITEHRSHGVSYFVRVGGKLSYFDTDRKLIILNDLSDLSDVTTVEGILPNLTSSEYVTYHNGVFYRMDSSRNLYKTTYDETTKIAGMEMLAGTFPASEKRGTPSSIVYVPDK